MTEIFIRNKKVLLSLFSFLVIGAFSAPSVFAVWSGTFYSAGETLNPECAPTDIDCDVLPPMALKETGAGTDTVTIQAPAAIGTSFTLTLPTDDGTASQYLQTDGSGNLTWATISAGLVTGTTAITSGTDTRVLFNDGGLLGEDAGFTYNKTTDALKIAGSAIVGSSSVTPPTATSKIVIYQGQLAFTDQTTPFGGSMDIVASDAIQFVRGSKTQSATSPGNISFNTYDATLVAGDALDAIRWRARNTLSAFSDVAQIGVVFQGNRTADFQVTLGDGSSLLERFRVTSTGNVGIGTTIPDKALEINSATGANLRLTYNDSNGSAANYADLSTSSIGGLTITSAGTNPKTLVVNNSTSTGNIFEAQDNGTAVFTVADGGAVTATGTTTLDNAVIGAMDFEADSGIISWVDMSVSSTPADNTVQSYTAGLDGNPMITVYGQADGAGATDTLGVGIRTTAPTATLHVAGTTGTQKTFIANNNTSTGNIIEAQDGGVSVFSVADGGVVTIAKPTSTATATQMIFSNGANGGDYGNTYLKSYYGGAGIYGFQATSSGGANTMTYDVGGGVLTLTGNGIFGTEKTLVINNGTKTGNIFEAQDGGTAVFTVADGGNARFINGSTSLPAISQASNTGTGISFDGSSSGIAFSLAGTEVGGYQNVANPVGQYLISGNYFGWGATKTSLDLLLSREAGAILQLGVDVNGTAIDQIFKAHDGITGTNISGASLTIAAGRGTGSGAGGSIIFQTAPVLASGTTAQTLVTAMTIEKSGLVSISDLSLGATSFEADAGIVSWMDMPVTASAAINTVESYVAQLDGNPMLSVYGLSDGTGGVKTKNLGVGIGTATPLVRLDVAGSGRVTGTTTSVLTGSINPTASATVTGVGTLFTTELVVGDRITVSAETRTVTAIASATSLTVDTAFTDTADDASPDKLNAIFVGRDSSNAVKFVVNDLGWVGIGTESPGTIPLVVKGTATGGDIAKFTDANTTGCTLATGGTISCSSDERLKKNIEVINYGLDTVMALRPVLYNWKYETDGTTKSLGFIAQEVEALMPKLVSTDTLGMKSLNTTAMMPVLTKAIQEMNINLEAISGNITPESESFVTAFFNNVREWLASASNGITNIFAGEVETQNLCVSDGAGAKTCITKAELDALILNAGITAPEPTPAPAPEPDPLVPSEPVEGEPIPEEVVPEPEPAPEEVVPEPEPEVVPEPAPEPTPEVTP